MRWVIGVIGLGVCLGGAGGVGGQSPVRLFPDRGLLPELLAGPRDPVVKGQLVHATSDPTRFGPGSFGEVAIGAALPVLAVGPSLVVGLEGAAFARFSFGSVERQLVNTDWVFAVPVVWRRGAHWARLRYYHTSSHLGDEYVRTFPDARAVNFSRDGADLTVYARPHPVAGVYGLAFWSLNSHPEEGPTGAFRAGAELDPRRGVPWRPWAAADVEWEESAGWRPRVAARAGAWLPPAGGRPLRIALELVTGPSVMGQFHSGDGTQLGVGLIWSP